MTAFLGNLMVDMATTFFRPFTAMKRGWNERRGGRYLGAAWALVLALLAWGFLLSLAVGDVPGGAGIEFYFASIVIIVWSITASYAALLVLAMFVISALRKPTST